MAILPLPDTVVAQIKSSLVVTSLNEVACGLIKNSLDAGATRINISIDYTHGNCSVEDNGEGITPSEFRHDGGLGKLHYTSKHPPRDDIYGKRGEFLAAVAALSLLSITSHHQNYRSHNSIKFHNSEVIARHVPALPEQQVLTFDHGTRVTVRDLFGSMPVRVKQRPSASEAQKDWTSLLHLLSGLLLSWPMGAFVGLHCVSTNQTISLKPGENSHKSDSRKALSLPSKVPRVLWQAGILDSPDNDPWVPLTAKANNIYLHGCISLVPSASKKCQFISLGLEPVQNEFGTNVLYDEINRLFSNSGFGIEEDSDLDEGEKERRMKDKRYKSDGFTNQALKVRKGIDRWPMFYLQINLNHNGVRNVDDILDERRPTLNLITDLLRATVFQFLKKNNFRPRKIPTVRLRVDKPRSRESSLTPNVSATRQSKHGKVVTKRPESAFDVWTIVKSGQPGLRTSKTHQSGGAASSTPDAQETPGSTRDLQLIGPPSDEHLRSPFADPLGEEDNVRIESRGNDTPEDENTVTWENPVTHVVSVIDRRTGFVRSTIGVHASRLTTPTSSIIASPMPAPTSAPWIDEMLANFENPVFENVAREQAPSLFDSDAILCGKERRNDGVGKTFSGPWCPAAGGGPPSSTSLTSAFKMATKILESRVSRDALREAKVIAQVDEKYILARMRASIQLPESGVGTPSELDAGGGELLVIVDQHAADERRRVEALMKGYHDPGGRAVAVPLDPGVHFDVSGAEAGIFGRFEEHFARWGVHYQVVSSSKEEESRKRKRDASSVVVVGLPPSISERCKMEPRLLIELLRKEVHLMEQEGTLLTPPSVLIEGPWQSDSGKEKDWLALFHGCPRGVLDMINSRACRSAIMFNDPLTAQECKELLSELAECALPFQCAHGRPSMVPLVGFGESFGTERERDEDVLTRHMEGDEQILGCELVEEEVEL